MVEEKEKGAQGAADVWAQTGSGSRRREGGVWRVLRWTGLEARVSGPAWDQLGWGVLSGPAGEGELVLGWVG